MSDDARYIALRNVKRKLAHRDHMDLIVEDMRQVAIWAQVGYFRDQQTLRPKAHIPYDEIQKITTKYPEALTEIADFVLVCRECFKFDLAAGRFLDGTGETYLTWCLKTFGRTMP